MKGSDGWLLHALSSIPPLCVCVCVCVGIIPSDEPPLAWSPSPPPGHWGRFWHKQPGGGAGQNFKIEGNLCANFWLLWIPLC